MATKDDAAPKLCSVDGLKVAMKKCSRSTRHLQATVQELMHKFSTVTFQLLLHLRHQLQNNQWPKFLFDLSCRLIFAVSVIILLANVSVMTLLASAVEQWAKHGEDAEVSRLKSKGMEFAKECVKDLFEWMGKCKSELVNKSDDKTD